MEPSLDALSRIATVPRARELERRHARGRRLHRLVQGAVLLAGFACALTPSFQAWLWAHPWPTLALFLPALVLACLGHALTLAVRREVPLEEVADARLGRFTPVSLMEVFARTSGPALGLALRVIPGGGNAHNYGTYVAVGGRLLERLTPEQLEAILGHEVGHGARRGSGVGAFGLLSALVSIAIALADGLRSDPSAGLVGFVALGLFMAYLLASSLAQPPSLAERRLVEHRCDWTGARQTGALPAIGALLKLQEAQRALVCERLEEVEQLLEGFLMTPERDRLVSERAALLGVRDSPCFVSWRRFDVNGNGELDARELPILIRELAPWPTLHLDARPIGIYSTHPSMFDRILFLVREQPELAAP